MSTHNIRFHAEIRKISIFWTEKSTLNSAMLHIHKVSSGSLLSMILLANSEIPD